MPTLQPNRLKNLARLYETAEVGLGLDDISLDPHRRIDPCLIGNLAHTPNHCVNPRQSGDVVGLVGQGLDKE